LPFVKIQAFSKVVPQEYVFQLPTVVIGEVTQEELLPVTASQLSEVSTGFQWQWEYLLWIGIVFSLVLLLTKIAKIFGIIRSNKVLKHSNISLVQLKNSNAAFSFFNYVFIGENIEESEQDIILKHELVHVQQKHSLDLLFFEILRVLFWYNPLIYIYQSKLRVLHEFIADQEALKTQDKATYYQNLLAQIFDTQNVSFINTFYKKSLIKKRIIMLQKSKSSQLNLAKYLVVLPLLFVMLAYNAAFAQEHPKSEATYKELNDEQLRETLYEELVEKENKLDNLFSLNEEYTPALSDKYINTRVEYYKFSVYMERIMEKRLESHPEDIDKVKEMLDKNKQTYDEYLAYKKTQESKDRWEAGMRDGKVRMFVNDVDNLTKEEENRKQNNVKMIEKDNYYHSLVLADDNNKLEKIVVHKKRHDKKRDEVLEIQTEYESVEVPFAVIDQIPLFPECSDLPKDKQRKCFTQKITAHVSSNFNTKLANDLGLTGKQRINVIFKIDKEGDVTGIRARASHPVLEEEARKVVATLPKMIPGQHKGKTVVVPYSLPIVFQIAEKEDVIPQEKDIEVPFAVIDQIPLYQKCVELTKAEQKSCLSNTVSEYVAKNFNTKLANKAGLTGKHRINVMFKVDKNGEITSVRARSEHEVLEKEAIRVVASLPKMIPGKHKGKAVVVPYSLPIMFYIPNKSKE
jgi:Na+-translocating ferredoxin:NAD+ oxidoreductase RnfG subunit